LKHSRSERFYFVPNRRRHSDRIQQRNRHHN
jgi:hypothetical protein